MTSPRTDGLPVAARASGSGVVSLALAAGGVVMLAAGIWSWSRSASVPPGPRIAFEPAGVELGVMIEGENRPVAFRVVNRDGNRPARLLGAEDRCTPAGCVVIKGLPLTIPPGGDATFTVDWKGTRPGRLVQDVSVFTDGPGQAIVILSIGGEVIAASPAGGKSP